MGSDRYDKLDISDEFLDTAIALFFSKKYFSAMNAAGAAQEIYGKQARIEGLKDQIQETIQIANYLAKSAGGPTVPDKSWKKIAGQAKNSIKHLDSRTDRFIELDPEEEARFMIFEAICEREKLGREEMESVNRFNEYARQFVRQISANDES